ncbi:SPFH domain-containing protein [Gallaecimonas kandeliae]|uniref:SPFH domain-containing protein n=1 Tax=Gallaecimonas kandeliae TaxID=3029055 RepID=UPI00264A2DBD|nr:SPFH domain-containing protein [Gallaecimonas kandeliae]WKE66914.1 SPFH domain-containing protein [Gallaecimonas kandeliae]
MKEIRRNPASGYLMLVVLPALMLVSLLVLVGVNIGLVKVLAALLLLCSVISLGGFFMVAPNEAKVLQLFGSYVGTAVSPGLRWANPFYSKKRVSQRVRNFDSDKLKVNDHAGNPIEIAAVVVWRVVDTYEAVFEVDDFEDFVSIQSEAAVRNLASSYPYDQHQEGEVALRSHTQDIAEKLKVEIQDRLDKAGVEVIEARISHLAYAPEIASAMLRRQQAAAIVAARSQLVEGAVSMVHMALSELKEQGVVELDEERKAVMVSNLLVVLCGESHTQPVVNAGSLY